MMAMLQLLYLSRCGSDARGGRCRTSLSAYRRWSPVSSASLTREYAP